MQRLTHGDGTAPQAHAGQSAAASKSFATTKARTAGTGRLPPTAASTSAAPQIAHPPSVVIARNQSASQPRWQRTARRGLTARPGPQAATLATMRATSLAVLILAPTAVSQQERPRAPVPAKVARARPHSPAEAIAGFELPPGYRLELVASEPMIHEPAVIAWDGNGRMYVAEMRTYMQDIDGSDELTPKSRISLLDDTDLSLIHI